MGFVHLHNHSDFSLLDAASTIKEMVKRAVALNMPALALTDHGYLFGIPDFDLACRAYNDKQADIQQWKHDLECFEKNWELIEPPMDSEDAPLHDRKHAQWASDLAIWNTTHDLEAVRKNKPSLTIKPIFGCEAYFVTEDARQTNAKPKFYHLILLAKSERGYINLMKMMSLAASKDNFYYKPRTTLEMLKRYHEDLICTSACVSGIIPQMILESNIEEARLWATTFKSIFGDDFYLEIQDHGISDPSWNGYDDKSLSEQIVRLGRDLGIKVIATNDNHYIYREDAQTQDMLSCIGTASRLDDVNRKQMTGEEFYLKSEQEMRELFAWCPEALDNTLEVAEKCNYELDWSHMYLPKFPDLEPGETSEQRFYKECEVGLATRYGQNWREREIAGINVSERFEYEYKIICEKGFADYFLIVQEYVRWAKEHGIGVGPGRGSAAGAIVAYAMDITTFDPLENGLMFERFLSPERSEMPDIDMDFDDERRLEVVEHVRQLYTPACVCHVITYSTIKAKQAINDAARVLGLPVWQGQRLSKMVSNDPKVQLSYVLHKSDNPKVQDQYSADLEEAYNSDADSARILDAALSLEGLHRGEGVHACAVLITPTPVNDHVPTKIDTKGGVEITQYEGHSVADMGLLKMDFLGLRTLTVISKAKANILANHGIAIDVDSIPFDDPEIFRLMREGRTAGVFQIESAGMTSTIKSMRPTEYKQVVALIALYRPGPLGAGMVTDYIDRMNGNKEVVYYDDRLADILSETYGTIVYQEQVMQISMRMSGFSAGESDKVRKAVAKKKLKLMTEVVQHWDDGNDETMQDHWMNGAVRNGYDRSIAEKIWSDVLKFASYAFNKSHSAGYAILVMQTAWIKAHYPREYMASVLTSYMGKTDKIVHYISACKHEGIKILPPDINESGKDFTATDQGIRFGLAGIRGVGEAVSELIMQERKDAGPFKNLHDFVDRMDASQTNRRVMEALIMSGAFDSTGYTRMQLSRFVDKTNPQNLLDQAARKQRDRATGQVSMFDLFAEVAGSGFTQEVPEPDGKEWDRGMKLAREHDVLGIYVSDHPLRPYEQTLARERSHTTAELTQVEEVRDAEGAVHERYRVKDGETICLAGMVNAIQRRTTKKGESMALVTLEDMEGEATLVIFPKLYKKAQQMFSDRLDEALGASAHNVFIAAEGKFERSDRGDQMICQSIRELELTDTADKLTTIEINVNKQDLDKSVMCDLVDILKRYPGYDKVELRVYAESGDVMRMELPTRINAENRILRTEIVYLFSKKGDIRYVV